MEYTNLYDFVKKNIIHIDFILKRYIELLSMLTTTEDIDVTKFYQIITHISIVGQIYITYKGSLDDDTFLIIATGTIIIEPKVIHGGRSVGHIEDLIVHTDYRGQQIGHIILNRLKQIGFANGCYKIILNCKDELKPFYEKESFIRNGSEMVYRID